MGCAQDVRKAHSKDRGPKHVKHVQVAECGKELENFISQQKFQVGKTSSSLLFPPFPYNQGSS